MIGEEDVVVGSITIRKVLHPKGGFTVRADYDDIGIFDAIGILVAELDVQRGVASSFRHIDG